MKHQVPTAWIALSSILTLLAGCGDDNGERRLHIEAQPIEPGSGQIELTTFLNLSSTINYVYATSTFSFVCEPAMFCAHVTRLDRGETHMAWSVTDALDQTVFSIARSEPAGGPTEFEDCVVLPLADSGSYTVEVTATDNFDVVSTFVATDQRLTTSGILPHCFDGDDPRQSLALTDTTLATGSTDSATGLEVAALRDVAGQAVVQAYDRGAERGFELHVIAQSTAPLAGGSVAHVALAASLDLVDPIDPLTVVETRPRDLVTVGPSPGDVALVLDFREVATDSFALEPVGAALSEAEVDIDGALVLTGGVWTIDERLVTAARLSSGSFVLTFPAGAWNRSEGGIDRTSIDTVTADSLVETATTWSVANVCGNPVDVDDVCALGAFGAWASACAELCP